VQQTESHLRTLFDTIDINHDGKLDREELRSACQRSGLVVSNAKLDRFFDQVDSNHDGCVSFDEWASVLSNTPQKSRNKAKLHFTSLQLTLRYRLKKKKKKTPANRTSTAIFFSSFLPMRPTSNKSYPISRRPSNSLPRATSNSAMRLYKD
jgi:hypothetical protein